MPERQTLLDLSKKKYHDLLIEGASAAVSVAVEQLGDTSEKANILPEGWAFRTAKKATRFSDAQRRCLGDKFNLGQATG